ncbi:MAG: type II secretion system F family protein [Pseudomonadota bacterium]
MSRPIPPALPLQDRADLFAHLAAMEKAGLPPDKAFSLLRLPGEGQQRLKLAQRLLARGNNPAVAGRTSALFTPLEASLVDAALASGSPAASYRRLADTYSTRASQLKRMRTRMVLPVAMLTAALFIGPLPALVTGALTPLGYFWQALRPLLMLGLLAAVAMRLPDLRRSHPNETIDRALLELPLFGPMHARRNARDFIESLAILLEAGLPMFEALPVALPVVDNLVLREQYERLLPALESGHEFSTALQAVHAPGIERLIAFAHTGEASGTLPEMLLRHVQAESASIAQFQEQAAEWAPRIFYTMVALWMASQIIGGPPPAMPAGIE